MFSATQWMGLVFSFSILLCGREGREQLLQCMDPDRLDNYLNIFEMSVCFHRWMKRPKFWRIDDTIAKAEAHESIQVFLKTFKEYAPRIKGNGLKIPKYHEFLHLCDQIEMYGPAMAYHTGICESHLKIWGKWPASNCQKGIALFTKQVVCRIHDAAVITRANYRFGIYEPKVTTLTPSENGRAVRVRNSDGT